LLVIQMIILKISFEP